MEQFLFYFVHWGIPILLGFNMLLNRPRSLFGVVSDFLIGLVLLGFLYNWGQWPIAAFIYVKYILLILIGISAYLFIKRIRNVRKSLPKGIVRNLKNSLLLLMSILFAVLFAKTYSGRSYDQAAVSLTFPLKNGTYYIASGGSNGVLNNHFGKGSKSQRYALDINQIGASGRISSGLGISENEAHFIFAEPVYAPCSGIIVELKNDVEDNSGTNMNVTAENGQGNFVMLDCEGTVISLVHLKKGSVNVKLGDKVQRGKLLAQVGNSGFSQEPHLHLQAAQWEYDSVLVGIPIKFNGISPFRNSLIVR